MTNLKKLHKKRLAFGRLLYFFAAWTVLIKYVLPISTAVGEGAAWNAYIYFWDAWWIVHLAVGWGLIQCRKGTWLWALLLTLAEIVIITVKFYLFVPNPVWSFWHVNWFVNKVFLLAFFVLLFFWLLRREVRELL